MGQALAKDNLMTVEEYLAFEEKSRTKHEYMDGEIFAMAGVKRNHSLISSNLNRHLGNQLENTNCEVHIADFRVQVKDDHYVYPDTIVVCGEVELVPDIFDTLTNPTVIIEILSKSTERRDRHEKKDDYIQIPSLQEYVLVSQNKIQVEHFARKSKKQWSFTIHTEIDDVLELNSIKCQIPLAQIYQRVEFPKLRVVKPKKNGK